MMPMIWKWDDMRWHGNRRKISLQSEGNTTMAQQARLLILILGPRRNLLNKASNKHQSWFKLGTQWISK
jgi:hypothetical protein